jgi:hypothetical protein
MPAKAAVGAVAGRRIRIGEADLVWKYGKAADRKWAVRVAGALPAIGAPLPSAIGL